MKTVIDKKSVYVNIFWFAHANLPTKFDYF